MVPKISHGDTNLNDLLPSCQLPALLGGIVSWQGPCNCRRVPLPNLIRLPRGLPGFESIRELRITPHGVLPLFHLEGLASFWAVPVERLDQAYEAEISDDDAAVLGPDRSCWRWLAILSLQDGELTANLLAPLVIDVAWGTAVQAVRSDQRYSHAHVVRPGKGAQC